MMKKMLSIFLRIVGLLLGYAGIMGLYFSYCFNTNDTELTFLSIVFNISGMAVFAAGIYLVVGVGEHLNIKVFINRLIVFISVLFLGLLYFYFFRYPEDLVLSVFGLVTLLSEVRLIVYCLKGGRRATRSSFFL